MSTRRAISAVGVRYWLIALVAGINVVVAGQSPMPALRKVAQFQLPGPGGKRFDYLTIDGDDHYLLSAHLGAGQTYVIDLRTNRVVATVADTPGVEGIEYVAELKRSYTSNAGDNTIGIVDLQQSRPKPSWTCGRTRS